MQVSKLVHAIKMGWIKPRKPKEDTLAFYDLWAQEDPNSILGRHKMHVPAPKLPLPGHEESYNPPPEYLPTEEEVSRQEVEQAGAAGVCVWIRERASVGPAQVGRQNMQRVSWGPISSSFSTSG